MAESVHLNRRGVLFVLSSPSGAGKTTISRMMLESDKDIALYINSPAGIVTGMFAIYDTIQHIAPDVSTVCIGMVIGAGEGFGIWSYQFVSSDEDEAWGFRGLSRAVTIGATAGAVGGYAVGYYLEPSPKSTLLMTSSVAWGCGRRSRGNGWSRNCGYHHRVRRGLKSPLAVPLWCYQ